jgi:hypothetical protein
LTKDVTGPSSQVRYLSNDHCKSITTKIMDILKYNQPVWDDSDTDGRGNLPQTQGLDEQGDGRCVTAMF